MKFVYKYLNCIKTVGESASILNQSVQEVDSFSIAGVKAKGVITAKIVDVQKHPNADKLKIITLDCGEKVVDVVTGAPNVEIEQIIAYAPPGAYIMNVDRSNIHADLASAQLIKIGIVNLRGIESHGMVCGADELGTSDSVSSELYLFPSNTKIGQPVEEIIPTSEVIETDDKGTAHRPDLLCYKGIETELSASTGICNLWKVSTESDPINSNTIKVNTYDRNLASIFCVAHVNGLENAVTPAFIKEFLQDNKVKLINFPTDITNYVMLTDGVPTHAFDYSSIRGNLLSLRLSKSSESIKASNNQTYKLTDEDVVIADENNPLDIAGIIGGYENATKNSSSDVVLTAASWNPVYVRKTSRRHNIRTEASARFERKLENNFVKNGFFKALDLITKYGKGEIRHLEIVDKDNFNDAIIKFNRDDVNKLSGIIFNQEQIDKYLSLLGYVIKDQGVVKPWWRKDVRSKADVIEDIVRLYGYDNVPLNIPSLSENNAVSNFPYQFVHDLETYSSAYFYQVKSSAMVKIGSTNSVEIANPIGDKTFMRTNLFESAELMATNFIHRGKDLFGLFEISNVYYLNNDRVDQKQEVIYAISDNLEVAKSKIGVILHKLKININNISFNENVDETIISSNDENIGQLKLKQIRNQNVFFFIFDLNKLIKIHDNHPIYHHYSQFPVVKRDIAFIVDKKSKMGDVVSAIKKSSDLIISISLFDKYKDDKIGQQNQSLAFHLLFQSTNATLKDAEVNQIMVEIESMLKKEFKVKIREQ